MLEAAIHLHLRSSIRLRWLLAVDNSFAAFLRAYRLGFSLTSARQIGQPSVLEETGDTAPQRGASNLHVSFPSRCILVQYICASPAFNLKPIPFLNSVPDSLQFYLSVVLTSISHLSNHLHLPTTSTACQSPAIPYVISIRRHLKQSSID